MVAVGDTAGLIQYVNSQAPAWGLDPAAVLSLARVEGWGGTTGDGGLAYGPWQDHFTEFSGRGPFYGYGRNNQQVQTWAWSSAGIDEVFREMQGSKNVQGSSGYNAVSAISTYFERPADIPGEIAKAWSFYNGFNNGTESGTTGSVSTNDPNLQAGAQLVSGQSTTSQQAETGSTGAGFTLIPAINGPGFSWPGIKIGTGWLWSIGFFILAGLLIIAGLIIVFRKQVEQAATKVGEAAAVAA
jgi:hypothetical protein